MAGRLEHAGGATAVTLRNLSREGALVESSHDLSPGAPVIFHKKELSVSGQIAWVDGRLLGIAFDMSLDPETVLRHVPQPKARSEQAYKRPGFRGPLSPEERRFGLTVWDRPLPTIEE